MKRTGFIDRLKQILRDSELVKAETRIKKSIKKASYKPLSKKDVETLQQNGNICSDWKKVKAAKGFDPSRVSRSRFEGNVFIGKTSGCVKTPAASFECGIYDSTVRDCTLGDSVLIRNVGLIANYWVGEGAALVNNGFVTAHKPSFGSGQEIPIAVETGGREILTFAELTIDVAETIAKSRGDKKLLDGYSAFVRDYISKTRMDFGVIAEGARVLNTPTVTDTYVGQHALVDGATLLKNSALLSNAEEITSITGGAYVVNSAVQWGCDVGSMSILQNAVLTEHCHVRKQGMVTDSIIGPNTILAEGEVTSSLVGPFVGFHHQALIIATCWPEGKGNVGYGANVGSNHTSRMPDQELWAGEGTFFGVDVNIKFPSDFSQAPYSVIATGVNALPQKVMFPFSLINTPTTAVLDISPAINEITPGWVLSDNIYMVKRNEGKYKKRNKATRTHFVLDVFRPDIMDLIINARARLEKASGKDFYTSSDVDGLGKNYMTEEARKKGIQAYTFYLKHYALDGLKKALESGVKAKGILNKISKDPEWEHCRKIIVKDLPEKKAADLLDLLVEMEKRIAVDVEETKKKDDIRGAKIIPDYEEAHSPASEDSFVKETWKKAAELEKAVKKLKKKL